MHLDSLCLVCEVLAITSTIRLAFITVRTFLLSYFLLFSQDGRSLDFVHKAGFPPTGPL